MSSVSNVIFLNEIVRVTFLFLFFLMLLCIYFCLFFFKNYIFLVAFNHIRKFRLNSKIILQSKFYKKLSAIGFKIKNRFIIVYEILCSIKISKEYFSFGNYIWVDTFLIASTFISLLYLKKKINNAEVAVEKLMNILPYLHFLFYFIILFFLMYVGYVKRYIKQETYLYPELFVLKIWIPFVLILEGYFVIMFFLLQPLYKSGDFLFVCLFKYLEHLYYNFLPKFNLLLAFSVWGMLVCLKKTNKYQVLFENFSSSGFLLIFLCYLLVYFYFRKKKKMLLLINAYLSCANFFIAICVLFVVLMEKLLLETPYKVAMENIVSKNIETEYVLFYFLFFLLGIGFIYNKELFLNAKKLFFVEIKSFNFVEFFIKNLGYFFFNGFAITRVFSGGIIKKVTESVIDTNIAVVENAVEMSSEKRREVLMQKPLEIVVPKTPYNYMACLADNVVNIRKYKPLQDEFRKDFHLYKNLNPYFKMLVAKTYEETEGSAKFIMRHGRESILLGNCWPIWFPDNLAKGPDTWVSHLNAYLQLKTYDQIYVKKLQDDFIYYEKQLRANLFKLAIYFDTVKNKKEMLEFLKKNPEASSSIILYDSTKIESDPKIIKEGELWLMKNKEYYDRMEKIKVENIKNQMLKICRRK